MTAERPEPGKFFKASGSGDVGCVEVAIDPATIRVRDSKNQGGPVLEFTPHEWEVFLQGVRDREFDLG